MARNIQKKNSGICSKEPNSGGQSTSISMKSDSNFMSYKDRSRIDSIQELRNHTRMTKEEEML